MSTNERKEKKEKKEKRRLFDETGKRLVREIRPLRGWILLCAFLCLLPGLMGVVNFRKTGRHMSEADRYIIEAEIQEPGTITLKNANVFLTSRHLVYADADLVILPFPPL